MTDASIIDARGLHSFYGASHILHGVDFLVRAGEAVGLMGRNGMGKTTLINVLSGDLSPSSGSVLFRGIEIAHLAPERRSRLGVGRSYQKVNIFPAFSVLENCRLAAQSREPRPLNWLQDAMSYDGVLENARQALSAVGLGHRAAVIAATLSHGEQRQLEIAMSLATDPKLLLLDEPLAGMGSEESLNMVELIGELTANHAILLVEHDMDAVFRLAQVLTVMVNGKILASGAPKAIRTNREVQSAYLGGADEPL